MRIVLILFVIQIFHLLWLRNITIIFRLHTSLRLRLLTLLIHNIKLTRARLSCEWELTTASPFYCLLFNQSYGANNIRQFIRLELGHFSLIPFCIQYLCIHINRMVNISPLLLQIYVINIAITIDIRSPMWLQLFC